MMKSWIFSNFSGPAQKLAIEKFILANFREQHRTLRSLNGAPPPGQYRYDFGFFGSVIGELTCCGAYTGLAMKHLDNIDIKIHACTCTSTPY